MFYALFIGSIFQTKGSQEDVIGRVISDISTARHYYDMILMILILSTDQTVVIVKIIILAKIIL
jgi:hypothetical protein